MGLSGYSIAKSGKSLENLCEEKPIAQREAVSNSTKKSTKAGKKKGTYMKMNLQFFAKKSGKAVEKGSNTVNPKDVNFMQSSIKNQTGEYTVLGNAEALKNGTLQATDLPEIRIWQDADGKLWTLDHRRLAAFRIAELDSVPFRWATDEEIAGQMWKMTTKTNGTSIKLKLGNGESMTIQ